MIFGGVAVALSAVAYYYAAGIGYGHALGSQSRFRIILAMLFAQSVGLVLLGAVVLSLLSELRPYQRAASKLALLKGMYVSLDIAADNGGLSLDVRQAIYKQADAVWGEYADMIKEGERGV